MKFLLFNITVAAALIYLFTAERSEVENAAARIHDAATEMKAAAGMVVDRGRRLVGRPDRPIATNPGPAEASPQTRDFATGAAQRPPASEQPKANPVPSRIPADLAAAAPALPAAAENPNPSAPAEVPELPKASDVGAPSDEEAAALRRREEILRGIDPAVLAPAAKREAASPPPAMSAEERRKQLDALSEEMELFYARSLGN
ncbi:MAG: hypothetical protein R3229_03035 [Alphaproteobacteria bacterium]|nr:hypothetical protein [Alphaproteobacteria bacterium]